MNLEGTRLGKYVLGPEIGRGIMGVVYRATDPALARPVAIKVLAPHLVQEKVFVQRLLQEAQDVSRLKHADVGTVYALGEQDGVFYLVMAYLAGEPLSRLLNDRWPFSTREALSILRQLADVLDSAHGKGIIHGDLKPANVMVEAGAHIKLTDLGLIRAARETQITASGRALGTPQYMSPEQADGIQAGPPSDQYSMGVIAHELLTGAPPLSEASTPTILDQENDEMSPPIASPRLELSPAVMDVLNQALAQDPKGRYISCIAFVEALEAALKADFRAAEASEEPQVPLQVSEAPLQASKIPLQVSEIPRQVSEIPLLVPRVPVQTPEAPLPTTQPLPRLDKLPSRLRSWRWIAAVALGIAILLVAVLTITGLVGRSPVTPTPVLPLQLEDARTRIPTDTPTSIAAPTPATRQPAGDPTRTAVSVGSSAHSEGEESPATPPHTVTPGRAPAGGVILPSGSGAGDVLGRVIAVQVPVADVRAQPDAGSELVTQVIMGERVTVHEQQEGWYRISAVDQPSPDDPAGYPGWVPSDALSLRAFEPAHVAIVMVPSTALRTAPDADAAIIHNLTLDSRLEFISVDGAWLAVNLPDGWGGWVARDDVRLVCREGECPEGAVGAADLPLPADEILRTALQFIGTGYLWGGTSASAFDCSGLVYRVFHANGITIPRDSLPMSQSGAWVERSELRPGDVVFIAEGEGSDQVEHCAIYIGEGQVITNVGSDPFTVLPLDETRYRDNYWGARRYP